MTNDDDRRAAAEMLEKVEEYDHGCDCDTCCYLRTNTLPIVEQAFTAHRIAAERRGIDLAAEWQDIATAPKDGTVFLAYSQGHDLPPFISTCAWHRDAGFCTDELREPTHWMPFPAPPAIRSITEGA